MHVRKLFNFSNLGLCSSGFSHSSSIVSTVKPLNNQNMEPTKVKKALVDHSHVDDINLMEVIISNTDN